MTSKNTPETRNVRVSGFEPLITPAAAAAVAGAGSGTASGAAPSAAGAPGGAALEELRKRLETIVLATPPLLRSVGQTIPRSWLNAMSAMRALRDGREPLAVARRAAALLDTESDEATAAVPPLPEPQVERRA